MKIQKKFAVILFNYIFDYLDCGYWPLTPEEGLMLNRVLGFGLHHKMLERAAVDSFCLSREIPGVKPVARVELDREDALSIQDMMEESIGKDIDPSKEITQLMRYLHRELIDG